jgi:hypothetical protein
MALETVHTINQYCDGPELGVADFEGIAHVFERLTERHDGCPEVYRLCLISADGLSALLEDWQLYLRWKEAQDERSLNAMDDGPRVLPSDLPRYLDLKPLVEATLRIDEARAVKARGTFVDNETKVEWQRL